jgi:hypothetical protein
MYTVQLDATKTPSYSEEEAVEAFELAFTLATILGGIGV